MSRPGYLEAVDSQTAASLLVAALQVADDAVMHILLLLAQEVRRDGIQGVAAQLVVSLDGLQQVKLDAAINGDLLVIVCAVSFAAELGISHAELAAAIDQFHLEMLVGHSEAYVLHAACSSSKHAVLQSYRCSADDSWSTSTAGLGHAEAKKC